MKKVISISVLALGALVLSGCGQKQDAQVPAAPAPVATTQPATTQPAAPAPAVQTPATQVSDPVVEVSKVVKSFYDIYFVILANSDAEYAKTKKAVQFGDQVKQQEAPYVTSVFFSNTENKTPLACTTDWSDWQVKSYGQPIISGATATERIEFGTKASQKNFVGATIMLKNEGGTWKLDNVKCDNI